MESLDDFKARVSSHLFVKFTLPKLLWFYAKFVESQNWQIMLLIE
jgi:hypothetical protein